MGLTPRIILKPPFSVVGLSRPLTRLNGDFEALWEELGDRYTELPQADPDMGYGVHTWEADERLYLAGLVLLGGGAGRVPDDMTVLRLEAQAYAIFTHTGTLRTLLQMVARIFDGWMPGSGYKSEGKFYFEYYDDRFTPGSPDSVLFLWVPVVQAM